MSRTLDDIECRIPSEHCKLLILKIEAHASETKWESVSISRAINSQVVLWSRSDYLNDAIKTQDQHGNESFTKDLFRYFAGKYYPTSYPEFELFCQSSYFREHYVAAKYRQDMKESSKYVVAATKNYHSIAASAGVVQKKAAATEEAYI